jgi:hypothetical protein
MVDDLYQVIVASNLSKRANDSEEVEPIFDILEENLGGTTAGMATQQMPNTSAKPI